MAKVGKTKKTAAEDDVLVVDFTDTQAGDGKKRSGRSHYDEGDYKVVIKSAENTTSPTKKTPEVHFELKFVGGKYDGDVIHDHAYKTPKSLWRLRRYIEATGAQVPSSKVKLTLSKLFGKEIGITIEDEEYEKDDGTTKISSRITDVFHPSELKGRKNKVKDEDDLADDDFDEDGDDEDEDELDSVEL